MKLLLTFILIVSFSCHAQNWSQIGPEGGYFKEFTIDPSDNTIIYAGSDDGGGIWKSTDSGASWNITTANFPNMTGWRVVIDDNNSNVVYGCDVYGRYGILKSTDGGTSWTVNNIGLNSAYDKMVSGLVAKTSDTLFISTGENATSTPMRPGNGMFKSYNGGVSWSPAGLQGETIPAVGKNDFGTIFAGTEGAGTFYTNDNGNNWIVHPDIPQTGVVHEIQTIGNVMIVASSEGIFLSGDWGITFTNIGLVGEFNFDACIHTLASDVVIFSSTLSGLQRYSQNAGTWVPVAGTYFTDQIIIGLASDGSNIYCSGFSNSPIEISNDGGTTWNQATSSPIATELTDVYLDPSNNNHIMCSLLGSYNLNGDYDREAVYETTDGGTNWARIGPDAHGLCLTVTPSNDQEFYLGSFAQGVYKTTDGFNTFTQLSNNGVGVVEVIVSASNPDVVLISEIDWSGPTPSIKRSDDGGNTFNTVASTVTNQMLFYPANNDTIYAATSSGVLRSTDNGLNFTNWQLSGENCLSLGIRNNDLFVGTADGKLFKVSNGSAQDISGSWGTPVEIKSILVEGQDLFVGLNGAEKDTSMELQGSIWRTNDDGTSWNNVTTDMTSTNIYGNNNIKSDGTELYVGTYGGGIFKSTGMNLTASIPEWSDVFNTEHKKVIKTVDLMGRDTKGETESFVILIYEDGTSEKVFKQK